jgi:hypothetical protein
MPYKEGIDIRIQSVVSEWKNSTSKKIFGGVCYLLNGNMVAGVYKDFLILRLGEDETKAAMAMPHVKPFDITGRPMKGWVMVEEEGFKNGEELSAWLDKARAFVEKLPPK